MRTTFPIDTTRPSLRKRAAIEDVLTNLWKVGKLSNRLLSFAVENITEKLFLKACLHFTVECRLFMAE